MPGGAPGGADGGANGGVDGWADGERGAPVGGPVRAPGRAPVRAPARVLFRSRGRPLSVFSPVSPSGWSPGPYRGGGFSRKDPPPASRW
ncbi:hypothetical protein GCM10010327_03280 [Streptomyces nitrosporeus]|nr:hypothetical protein GCM10010327_03280 [Streptomyces nitrosporeus]